MVEMYYQMGLIKKVMALYLASIDLSGAFGADLVMCSGGSGLGGQSLSFQKQARGLVYV